LIHDILLICFFFSSRRRHTIFSRDWSSDVCSSDLCLFCVHFGLHATEEDLVRLLTIQRWVEVQTQLYASNLDEGFAKYSPYIEKIDQVFDELPKSSEEHAELVRHSKTLFAEGSRDPYWAAKINALLDLEAV